MESRNSLTHVCGGVYLLLILTGLFSLAYVPMTLIAWDDAAQTVANIRASSLIFRLSIVSGIVCLISYTVLVLLLYRLLKSLGGSLAVLMLVFVLVSVPITFVGFSYLLDVLSLLGDEAFLSAIPVEQRDAQIMLSFSAFNNANAIAGIFWGLWLFPFGILVYRSGFLPKVIGVFLVLGCVGYVVEFLLHFLLQLDSVPFYVSLPGTIGEFGICLWMLIMGSKKS